MDELFIIVTCNSQTAHIIFVKMNCINKTKTKCRTDITVTTLLFTVNFITYNNKLIIKVNKKYVSYPIHLTNIITKWKSHKKPHKMSTVRCKTKDDNTRRLATDSLTCWMSLSLLLTCCCLHCFETMFPTSHTVICQQCSWWQNLAQDT